MTRLSASTLVNLTHVQMLPSQPQLTGKRKPEDSNPLLNAAAAKRAKKEAKLGASNKRKLNNEEGPGGLLVVRATESQPAQSQPATTNHVDLPPRFASQPPIAGPSKPPSKKFRADSEAPAQPRGNSKSKLATNDNAAHSPAYDDSEVEKDVRAMEDEADHLRRHSRAHTTIDSSLLVRPDSGDTSRSKGKTRIVDTIVPVPDSETPQLERNKQMRSGAMAAIQNGRGRTLEQDGNHTGHRRKSSVGGRGKRISTSFEMTGVITQPHNTVSESSFYKHIDCDLPEPERIRQLLIWCSLRAASTPSSSSKSSSSSKPPLQQPPLPPLSAEGAQVLKSVQEDLVRMLAEKRIDFSLYSSEASSSKRPGEELRANEQNVRNRQLEVAYTQHIQQSQAEEEAWKKVSYGYEAYTKKLQTSLDKRRVAVQLDPGALSAKAKGKRRATGEIDDLESQFIPSEQEIPPAFHPALTLAKSVLGHRTVGDDRIAGGGSRHGRARFNMSHEEMEAELKRRLPDLEFKVDQIFSYASTARTMVNVAEEALNERYDLLSAALTSRISPYPPPVELAPGSSTQLLSTYVAAPSSAKPDPLDLMRALSRVDQERPPAQVGDAARRAAREIQRAEENGAGAVGDRRLTGVPPMPATPRKTPGTPRRGNTPSRDRDR
ncbi:Mis12-Mtw1 protein family-domain-containing protein [Gymnopilus junonius]|uniref:Mis12-Mtw1 protein family-domain-containing protein n=1 Tax=Gymnopilus junonius TaxID=109634 RepID=A0A9P5NZC9_GYMJU|nr:Mis12-Mtw1 protein family-domain-containing protein [Gymnopilus junonius]